MLKTYDLHLPYYKQGDDLAFARQDAARARLGMDPETDQTVPTTPADSLRAFQIHADRLEAAARTLRRLAAIAAEHTVEIDCADTHHISVVLDDTIGATLVADNILWPSYVDEDEDEDEEVDDDYKGH